MPDDAAAPEVTNSVLDTTAQGMSIDGADITVGDSASYSDIPLDIVYADPTEDYPDGTTTRYGTFTVEWFREDTHLYSVAVTWNPPDGQEATRRSAVLTLTLGMADGTTETQAEISMDCLAQAAYQAQEQSLISANLSLDEAYDQDSVLPAALCIRDDLNATLLFAPLAHVTSGQWTDCGTFNFDTGTETSVTAYADLEAGADSWTACSDMTGACYTSAIDSLPISGESTWDMTGTNADGSAFQLRIAYVSDDGAGAYVYRAFLLWTATENSQTVDGAYRATLVLDTQTGDGETSSQTVDLTPLNARISEPQINGLFE